MSTADLPHIHLLCMEDQHLAAFQRALLHLWPTSSSKLTITTHNHALSQLPSTVQFDLIVSPANSYARLDGAFDDAISRAFSPKHDYHALTRAAQRILYDEWRGFAPPGTCTIVPFPDELKTENIGVGSDSKSTLTRNVWGCRFVAICPTMRTPDNVTWDREVVYECVWSLMCQVEKWNRPQQQYQYQCQQNQKQRGDRGDRIDSILITPMATGIGKVSADKWAAQFVLALKHFVDAVERPERWSQLDWGQIVQETNEVEKTWKM